MAFHAAHRWEQNNTKKIINNFSFLVCLLGKDCFCVLQTRPKRHHLQIASSTASNWLHEGWTKPAKNGVVSCYRWFSRWTLINNKFVREAQKSINFTNARASREAGSRVQRGRNCIKNNIQLTLNWLRGERLFSVVFFAPVSRFSKDSETTEKNALCRSAREVT